MTSASSSVPTAPTAGGKVDLPQITEDDLLAFQFAHFGDDSRPAEWFIDPAVALNYDPAQAGSAEEDDGLGFYADGVKRTLTDANIAFFRALEGRKIEEERQRREMAAEDESGHVEDAVGEKVQVGEADERRPAEKHIPYAERHKRNWEQYIEGRDAVEGSLTHRRMARELDDQKAEAVEMDY